jgi:hypothetical protein
MPFHTMIELSGVAACEETAYRCLRSPHPVFQEFGRRLQAALRRRACGTPAQTRRGRPEDPRLEKLHDEEEALRARQRADRLRRATEHGELMAAASIGTLESMQADWLRQYATFRADGTGHRAAVRSIAHQSDVTVDIVAEGIVRARAQA